MSSSKTKSARAFVTTFLALFIFMAIGSTLQADNLAASQDASYASHAAMAIATLQQSYNSETGLYNTTGWWNSANAITVLADYEKVTGSKQYESVYSNTLIAAPKKFPGFLNDYYDDEGWWALAWIDVYEITRDQRYLDATRFIFKDMTGAWDNTCSGGIWWSKERKYKNAIANELFLSVAAQLANQTTDRQERAVYVGWAEKEWRWFAHSGMINASNLVNDGLTAQCENNRLTTWTYNQGVLIGGLVALNKADQDKSLITTATVIADSTLASLADTHLILHDSCEPKCGGDGTQFKGIFVRNLRALNQAAPQPQYKKFVLANADSIWSQVKPPDAHLGAVWTAPFGASDASTQTSASEVLITAAQMSSINLSGH
jgi:predicted alpha-1,6-mannanase (GH76 family)